MVDSFNVSFFGGGGGRGFYFSMGYFQMQPFNIFVFMVQLLYAGMSVDGELRSRGGITFR
jgi:hypothetical protein